MRFVSGNPPHLAIRAEYRLANVGTAPLDSIEIGLPGEKGFGLGNLRVKIDGREVTPQRERSETSAPAEGETAAAETWPETWRIPFESRWTRRQHKNLVLEYDLAVTPTPDPRMSVAPNAFYLNDSGWFPDPISTKALFATDVVRPDPSELIVEMPANFVATASGEPRGTHKTNSETEFRFRLHKDDFDPYVVAGLYQQQRVSGSGVTVELWAAELLAAPDVQTAASRVTSTYNLYSTLFGSLPQKTIWIINDPGYGNSTARNDRQILIFPPPQVVFSPVLVSVSPDTDEPFPSFGIRRALAWSWFGHAITPRPEAWLLARGLAEYASALSGEALHSRGGNIASALDSYDQLQKRAVEKPINELSLGDPYDQVSIGRLKIVLFLFALEDRCGRENLDHALAHMVYALRGQEYGYTDLRAALEQECHQDLSSMFAAWLDQKGIPADFRARYENATSK